MLCSPPGHTNHGAVRIGRGAVPHWCPISAPSVPHWCPMPALCSGPVGLGWCCVAVGASTQLPLSAKHVISSQDDVRFVKQSYSL